MARRGVPLPLGAIHNKRSFVALDNLVSFIALCADRTRSPKAANQVFLISDGEDVSTTQLLRKVADALGKAPRLLPVPIGLMSFAARLIGKGELWRIAYLARCRWIVPKPEIYSVGSR